jgi:hypothetical protein
MVARLVRIVLGGLGFALYIWFAAVRNVPQIRARKASRRAKRKAARS